MQSRSLFHHFLIKRFTLKTNKFRNLRLQTKSFFCSQNNATWLACFLSKFFFQRDRDVEWKRKEFFTTCSLMKLQQIKRLLTSKTQNIISALFLDVFELYGFFNPFSLVVSPLNWNFVSPPSLSVIIERSISSVAYLINELPFIRCLLLRSRSVHDPSQKTNKKLKFLLAREAAEKLSLGTLKNVIKAAPHAISFFVFTRFCVFFQLSHFLSIFAILTVEKIFCLRAPVPQTQGHKTKNFFVEHEKNAWKFSGSKA